LIDRIARDRSVLWLDCSAYASMRLAKSGVRWLEADECIAWMRQAQGLVASDVILLPAERVVAPWIDGYPELAAAMAQKRRPVFPLKTLVADEGLRAHLESSVNRDRRRASKA
jgi:hypothetical protein